MTSKPTLRFFDLTMIVVSMVIGIGIFRNPSIIAQNAGSESIFFTAWIIGGIIALCGALIFAELGSRLPITGGFYQAFALSYPPLIAFTLTWALLALDAAAASAVAYAGAEYITPVVLPASWQNEAGKKLMFFAIIATLFIINYFGLRSGAIAQNILSSIKIGLMILFCCAIFFVDSSPDTVESSPVSPQQKNFLYALGTSLIATFFTYGGYQNTTNFGGDVRNPQRNITRAIITGVLLVMLLYLTLNVVYVKSLGFNGVQNSPLIAADIAEIIFGDAGAKVASVAIFISILGWLNTSLLFNPRILYAMSVDGRLPKIFSSTHQTRQVQQFSLLFYTLLIIFFFLILESYENLLNYVMFNDTIVLASAAFCIFIVRKKQQHQPYPGYRIRWFPLIPAVFILVTLAVTVNVIISDPRNAAIGFLVLLAGMPIYFLVTLGLNQKSSTPASSAGKRNKK